MASLSRATHFRKDISHIEEVERSGLEQGPIGITLVGEFAAYVRCLNVVQGAANPALADTKVWTGEQDGAIVQRNAISGEVVVKDGREVRIQRKAQTFVYCMTHVGDKLWCGLSDGYLRVYNYDTAELILEKRKHVGAINTMVYAYGSVFTGGNDFQILEWDPAGMTVVKQLSGSQNNVKALAYDGQFLFSGGDDNAIRCWDMHAGTECGGDWPVLAHADGVRALAVGSDGTLYSGGKDGYVKKWDTATVTLLNTMYGGVCSVTSLALLENSRRLLVGSSSGGVTVLNMATFEAEGTIADHRNTMVNHIVPIARVDAVKLYLLGKDNVVHVFYTESDSVDPAYVAAPQVHTDLQQRIETMRGIIVENYSEIEARKAKLQKLKAMDDLRKEQVRNALRSVCTRQLSRDYYDKLVNWLRIRRNARRRKTLGECLRATTLNGLRGIYYSKLVRYATTQRSNRQRKDLADTLLKSTNKGLQSLYFRNCLEYLRREDRHKKVLDSASIFMGRTTKGFQSVYFGKWRRWQIRAHNQKKRDMIAAALMKSTEKGMITVYFKKVMDFYALSTALKKRETSADIMSSVTTRGTLHRYYHRLFHNRRINLDKKKKVEATNSILRCTEYGTRRLAYQKLVDNVKNKKGSKLFDKNAALEEKIRNLRKLTEDSSVLSDEELDERLRQTEDDILKLQKENEELARRIAELEALERDQQRLLLKSVRTSPGMTPVQQCDQIFRMIKARGVMCGLHMKLVNDTREMEKVHSKKPAVGVNQGCAKVRGVVKEATGQHVDQNGDYPFHGGSVEALTNKQMDTSLKGIREMVVSWDCITSRGQDPKEVVVLEEIIANSGWLLDIVLRDYNMRNPVKESAPPAKVEVSVPGTVVAQAQCMVRIRVLDKANKITNATGKVDMSVSQLSLNKTLAIFNGETVNAVVMPTPGTYKIDALYNGLTGTANVVVTQLGSMRIQAPAKAGANTRGEVTVGSYDADGKHVPCAGPVEAKVNGVPVEGVVLESGNAKIPVKYGAAGTTTTVEATYGGVTGTQKITVVDVPKVSSLDVQTSSIIIAGQPFNTEVTLLNDRGQPIRDANWGSIALKGDNVVSKSAPVINGVATVSATCAETGKTEITAIYKEQDIRKTFECNVGRPAGSPRAKAASPAKAAPVKPWAGFEIADTLVVKAVWFGGPASNAGVMAGDKVTKVGNSVVTDFEQFRSVMKEECFVGKKTKFYYIREGKPIELIIAVVDVSSKKEPLPGAQKLPENKVVKQGW